MRAGRKRLTAGMLAAGAAVSMLVASPGTASAAPAGQVDAGVPFSSIVYGTGCTYTLRVPVDSSGRVTFWEYRKGYPKIFIGAAMAKETQASVRWIPRRMGHRWLIAEQNGKKSRPALAVVHQGYGSRGLCFAL